MALVNTLAAHSGKQPSAPLIGLEVLATLDSSYPPGGYAFNPGAVLQTLGNYDKAPTAVAVLPQPNGGWSGEFDWATSKLKVLKGGGVSNLSLTAAGLAIGTSKPTVKIANTVTFLIAGVFKSKTTADTAFTATTHDITALAGSVQEAVYLVSLNASGTVTLTKGTTATGAGTALVPATPTGNAVVGHVRVAVDAGATDFDASSDDLDAAHLTVTYTDLAHSPNDQAAAEAASGEDLSTTPGSLRVLVLTQ